MRSVGLVVGATLFGCVACGQLLGTDRYRIGSAGAAESAGDGSADGTAASVESAGDGSADGTVASVESVPYLTGAQCEACLQSTCGDTLAACMADADCSGWLKDVREHPDPMSAYERYKLESELSWRRDQGDTAPSLISPVRVCGERCLGSCAVGQEFSCVGRFDWTVPFPSSLRTRISTYLNISVPLAAAHVEACRTWDECEVPIVSNDVDARGFAPLALVDADQMPSERVGYLAISGAGAEYRPWQWIQTRPFGTDDYLNWGVLNEATIAFWAGSLKRDASADQPLIEVAPFDCAGINAKGVSLEVWVSASGGPVRCPHCEFAYANADNVPSAGQVSYATAGREAFVTSVPTGLVHVVVRRTESPWNIVSIARVMVEAGHGYFIKAFPASAQELADFPDPTG